MAHTYYEDYKWQFKEDRRKGVQPQLSETVQQGLSYCLATLFVAAKQHRGVHLSENRRSRFAALRSDATIDSVRACVVRRRFADALVTSNHLTVYDIEDTFRSMRSEYADLDFSEEFQREVYKMSAVAESGDAEDALFSVFPRVLTNPAATEKMLSLNSEVNTAIWLQLSPEARKHRFELAESDPNIDPKYFVHGYNPLYAVIHAMHIAEQLSAQRYAVGRVDSGRIADDVRFTQETAFSVNLTAGEEQNYPLFRRLRRAGLCYVHSFDLYLTYLTDLCRLVEACLPPETQSLVQSTADLFLEARSAMRDTKAEKLW